MHTRPYPATGTGPRPTTPADPVDMHRRPSHQPSHTPVVADSAQPAASSEQFLREPSASRQSSPTNSYNSNPRDGSPPRRRGSAASYRSSSLGPGSGPAGQSAGQGSLHRDPESARQARQGSGHGAGQGSRHRDPEASRQAGQSSPSSRRPPSGSGSRRVTASAGVTPALSGGLNSVGGGNIIEGRTEAQFWKWVPQFQKQQGPLLRKLMELQEQNGRKCALTDGTHLICIYDWYQDSVM